MHTGAVSAVQEQRWYFAEKHFNSSYFIRFWYHKMTQIYVEIRGIMPTTILGVGGGIIRAGAMEVLPRKEK